MFLNTRYLSPVAIEGITQAPKGSYEWHDWWDQEYDRCYNGYKVGDVAITGRHYHYLNYWWIRKKDPYGNIKSIGHPDFIDVDHRFYHEFDHCKEEGKDLLLLARRQVGKSYKTSHLGCYEFSFVPHSLTVLTAGEEKYAKESWTYMITGLDEQLATEFYKHRSPDSTTEIMASYKVKIEGEGVQVRGIKSRILRITAKDRQALVGKSPSLVIYEEAGKFKGIKSVKSYIDFGMEVGGRRTGIGVMACTGGEDNTSIDEITEMMFNPDRYNIMSYENEFTEEDLVLQDAPERAPAGPWRERKRIGFFIGGDQYFKMDEHGNSLREESRIELRKRRKAKEGDSKLLLEEITQMPMTVEEALMVPHGNVFDIAALQTRKIDLLRYADADVVRTGFIDVKYDSVGNPTDFLWRESLDGPFRMTEPPILDASGKVVQDLYCSGTDSYDKDAAADPSRASFGACSMYKGFHRTDDINEKWVMTLVERPKTSDEFFEDTWKMNMFYGGARNLIEYSNILIGNWYLTHGAGHLLYERPEVAYATVINSQVQNKWGIDPQIRYICIQFLADYISSGGAAKIDDIRIIDALIAYKHDVNDDLVDSLAYAITHRREQIERLKRKNEEKNEQHFHGRRFVKRGGRLVAI